MCIALISTAHPDYALVLVNNRDEFLHRPTASASWWDHPNEHVLGGRDLLRSVQGTWLGVTKQGRIAVLTNFREENEAHEARSRGAIVNAFLTQPADSSRDTTEFAKSLFEEGEGLDGVGGFSLVCGRIGRPLAVISNRTPNIEGLTWLAKSKGETIGLSNAAFSDRSWPKVLKGEELMSVAIAKSVERKDTREELVEEMMKLLSTDTLPKRLDGQPWASYIRELQNSIFIPVISGGDVEGMSTGHYLEKRKDQPNCREITENRTQHDIISGDYGTQTQTVVLVSRDGQVTFVERRLFDSTAKRVAKQNRDRIFNFSIESWPS